MKLLHDPVMGVSSVAYFARLTDEFKEQIDEAARKVSPLVDTEVSYMTCYFEFDGDGEDLNEYDCCDSEECIEAVKQEIATEHLGRMPDQVFYHNDGDHDKVEVCHNCGKPLNETLTWCQYELEHLQGLKPWKDESFIKDNAFVIRAILSSLPTYDHDISEYAKSQGGEVLKEALSRREAFFAELHELVLTINQLIK